MILEGAATGIMLSGLLVGQAGFNLRPARDSNPMLTAGTDINDSFAPVTIRTDTAGDTVAAASAGDLAGAATRASIDSLRGWLRDPGEEAPSAATISKSMRWVATAGAEVPPALWMEPSVTASESGEVVLEWRKHGRRLTLYLLEDGGEAIRSWGASIDVEMDSVACDEPGALTALLRWVSEAGDGTAGR